MSETHDEHLDDLLGDYRRQFEELASTQQKLKTIVCTATSPRREVAVTAAFGGQVTSVDFPSSAYRRMAPAELAAAVQQTITEAQRLVNVAAVDLVAPTLPEGVDAQRLMSGDVGIEAFLPEPGGEDISSAGLLGRFEGREG